MDALWDGGPLGADRLKPQHTPPLQEPGDECHFIPSVFVVTARLCDPFLCLCGHCAFFISQLHTCKVVCGCFSHGCSAFAFAKSDGHIAHLAKALKPAAVVRLHSPVAHFAKPSFWSLQHTCKVSWLYLAWSFVIDRHLSADRHTEEVQIIPAPLEWTGMTGAGIQWCQAWNKCGSLS